MLSIENTQSRVKNTVEIYKNEFPNEYKAVCKQIEENRRINNDEYAGIVGEHSIKRKLYEIPEKLSVSLYKVLDAEENQWLISKKGALWFMKTFPQFNSSYKV